MEILNHNPSESLKMFISAMSGSQLWSIFCRYRCVTCVLMKNTVYGTTYVTWTTH